MSLLLPSCKEVPFESLSTSDTISSPKSVMPASKPFISKGTIEYTSNCEFLLKTFFLFEIFGKSSEIFGSVRESSGFWFLRSLQKDPSYKLLRASNDGKVEWNTIRCILPIAYRKICNGNPGV